MEFIKFLTNVQRRKFWVLCPKNTDFLVSESPFLGRGSPKDIWHISKVTRWRIIPDQRCKKWAGLRWHYMKNQVQQMKFWPEFESIFLSHCWKLGCISYDESLNHISVLEKMYDIYSCRRTDYQRKLPYLVLLTDGVFLKYQRRWRTIYLHLSIKNRCSILKRIELNKTVWAASKYQNITGWF